MKHLWFIVFFLFLLSGAFFLFHKNGESTLRGSIKKSSDGKSYLVIADDNGGNCSIRVDGKPWPHSKGEAGLIASGLHEITCGEGASTGIQITVPKKSVYNFDYWGP